MKKSKRPQLFGFINKFNNVPSFLGVIFRTPDNKGFIVYPDKIYDLEGDLSHFHNLDFEQDRFTSASEFSPLKIFYERGVIGYIDMRGKLHLTTKASLRSLLRCDIPRMCDEDHRLMAIEMLEKLG